MKRLAIVWALLLAVAAAAQDLAPETQVERQFAPGGNIQMRLAPGDYTISGTPTEHIQVTYRPPNTASGPVKVELQASGSNASLNVRHVGHNFHADIEVPLRSDLFIRLGAGDINIQGFPEARMLRCTPAT